MHVEDVKKSLLGFVLVAIDIGQLLSVLPMPASSPLPERKLCSLLVVSGFAMTEVVALAVIVS